MNDSKNGKKLMVGAGIYAIGTFGTKILMFLIVPLYTYYLDVSEMGIYDILLSLIGLVTPIISLQISDALYRWLIQDDASYILYLRVTYQFLIVASIITIIVIMIVDFFVSIPYLKYFLCALFSSLYFQIAQKILRGLKRQWLFAISGIVYTCVFLSLNIMQLCIWHRGIESLFISYTIANIIGIITIAIFERRLCINIFKRSKISVLKTLLVYSIPLIPNYLNWWIVDSSDRYIVLFFLGINANGILAIAHKFPTILQSIFGLFLNSWQDLAIENKKVEEGFFSSVFQNFYKFSFAFVWLLVPITKLFVWLVMGKDYKIACDFIPFYYLGAIFQAFCSFYGVGYLRTQNTKSAFFSSIYGAIMNAVVNICLIRIIGLQAAGVSTFVAFFIMWLFREKQNRVELGITIKWTEFLSLLLIDMLICMFSILGSIKFNIILFGVGSICFVRYNWKEVKKIVKMIKN